MHAGPLHRATSEPLALRVSRCSNHHPAASKPRTVLILSQKQSVSPVCLQMVPTCAVVRGNHPWPSRLIRRRIGRQSKAGSLPAHRTSQSAHSHAAAWANFATQLGRNQLHCDPREKYILAGPSSPPRTVADYTLFPFSHLRISVLDSQVNTLSLLSSTLPKQQPTTTNNKQPQPTRTRTPQCRLTNPAAANAAPCSSSAPRAPTASTVSAPTVSKRPSV